MDKIVALGLGALIVWILNSDGNSDSAGGGGVAGAGLPSQDTSDDTKPRRRRRVKRRVVRQKPAITPIADDTAAADTGNAEPVITSDPSNDTAADNKGENNVDA